MSIRYHIGNLFKHFGYRFSADYRWPTTEGNLVAISVETLLQKIGEQTIHLLQIDTEGMDLEILKLFFKADVVPPVINFESLHLSRQDRMESRRLLKDFGYYWIETEQDTFAILESLVKGC